MTLRRTQRAASRVLCAAVFVAGAIAAAGPGASQASPSQAELRAAKARLAELERDFSEVVERYNATRERLSSIQAKIASIELEVRDLEKDMSDKQESAVALATALYKGGSTGAAEVVLSSQDLAEIDSRLAYLESSEEAASKLFERLAADRQLLNAKLGELEEARADARTAQDRMAELKQKIEAKVARQEDEVARLNAAIQRAERRRREAAASPATASPASPSAPSISMSGAASGAGQIAVQAALSQVGKPYEWGGAGPDSYDCSGLTMWAWAHAGVSLPHSAAMQYAVTRRVTNLRPGDLLFYHQPISHEAMYIGGGRMVEAPYTGAFVRVVPLRRTDFVGAGRPGV